MRIYRITEHAPADVPLADLLDSSGNLRLNSDIEDKGYFTIQLAKGKVRLQARGYVGLIPLNERVVIDVVPRVPIANLSHLLRVSRHLPAVLLTERGYGRDEEWNESLLDVYARAMISHVETIASAGLMQEYERREEDSSFPRGRILATQTVTRLRPRGITHAATATWFQRTADNACNCCLKYALWFIASRYIRLKSSDRARRRLHQRVNALYAVFEGVELDHSLRFLHDGLVRGRQPLPSLRNYYRPALDVALAVILEHAVRIEVYKDEVQLPSLVLNMNKVFEGYLRNVLRTYAQDHHWRSAVLDGNSGGKKLLFDEAPSEDACPDIVLRDPDINEYPVLVEVKNIPVKGLSDRSAIEQAVTYGSSYRCNRVVLAHPRAHGQSRQGLWRMGNIGDLSIYQYVFDLAADDLAAEEHRLGESIRSLIAA